MHKYHVYILFLLIFRNNISFLSITPHIIKLNFRKLKTLLRMKLAPKNPFLHNSFTFTGILITYDSEYSHSSGLVTWVRNKSCQPDLHFSEQTDVAGETSVPSWRVVVPPATSVCSEKCKSGWQDLFLTHFNYLFWYICIFPCFWKWFMGFPDQKKSWPVPLSSAYPTKDPWSHTPLPHKY